MSAGPDGAVDPHPDELPAGLSFVRRTDEFTAETVPAGLQRGHRVAAGVWGLLEVAAGTVTFVVEEPAARQVVPAGGTRVIPPGLVHHVEPSGDARFAISFHR